MKCFLLILLVLFSGKIYCQSGSIRALLKRADTTTDFAYVELIRDTQVIAEGYQPLNKTFWFDKLQSGNYILLIHHTFDRDKYKSNIAVLENHTTEILIEYPGACSYVYPKRYKPKCPYGHTDQIIPIVYGLPGPKLLQKSKEGRVQLGGCIISDCDPHYYCRVHKIEI
jgi:hypothetical protein